MRQNLNHLTTLELQQDLSEHRNDQALICIR